MGTPAKDRCAVDISARMALSVSEASAILGVSENHFRDHILPDLGAVRSGSRVLIPRTALETWLAPGTIKNTLSLLRMVLNQLVNDGRLIRNPAANAGRIARQVQNANSKETETREAFNREEAATLLAIAQRHEPKFAPLLELLFATGMRRGEAIGLKWADLDFGQHRITVRRSITSQGQSTPKSGKERRVVMTSRLEESLFDLLTDLNQARIKKGWPEVPEWVFCSGTGTAPDPRNVERVWYRVRRRAQKEGVRPLPLHSARHSWATWALQAGKNIRWVADQLGHADPSTTLTNYAHAMHEDDQDLSFLELPDGTGRHKTAPVAEPDDQESRKSSEILERETRFELATLSLGKRTKRPLEPE